MSAPDPDEQVSRDLALLREIAEARGPGMARLREAGFDDLQEDELLLLCAVGERLRLQAVLDLLSELQMAGDAAGQSNRLTQRGYLELRAGPQAPGRSRISVTPRGSAARLLMRHTIRLKRWAEFPFRPGDIVLSAPMKSGTTWVQMICALLIFQTSELPAPLPDLSPWLDDTSTVRGDIFTRYEGQEHRRFIKTHQSLAEIPVDPRVSYVTIARHPLDSAVSFYHIFKSAGEHDGQASLPPADRGLPAREALIRWIDDAFTGGGWEELRLASVMRHLSDAWGRRDEPNVLLLHYEDLSADLSGQMRGLAADLGITVPEQAWPALVQAATFEQMRAIADRTQPLSILADPRKFFRSGRSGAGRELLSDAELAHYHERAARLAPPDLLSWLHRSAPAGLTRAATP